MKKDGVNGLTRANMLSTGIDGLTSFDAGGMIGTVDIKNKVPTSCSMITQLQKGKFVRLSPRRRARSIATSRTRCTIKADLIGS